MRQNFMLQIFAALSHKEEIQKLNMGVMGDSAVTDTLREEVRGWVRSVLKKTGWTAFELARRAGVSGSTLTGFLNSPATTHVLSLPTIRAISIASDEPVPTTFFSDGPPEPPWANYEIMRGALAETDHQIPSGSLDDRARTLVDSYNFLLSAVSEGVDLPTATRLARRQFEAAEREIRRGYRLGRRNRAEN